MLIDRTVSNINRLTQVINTLAKYSFEDILTSTALKRFVPAKRQLSWTRRDKLVFHYTRWERIRMVIEELGPTFIKLAQVLSNRPDILPEPLIKEFEKLQNQVPAFSTQIARQIIEKELGKPIDEVFSYFDNMVIGSASIGQVHRARLKNGKDVVVKIQRPGIYKKVKTDLTLLHEFVKLTENYFINNGILNPLEIVDTFEQTMLRELDYNTEVRSIEQFRNIYKYYPKLHIPEPQRDLCTRRILILEFISGCKINDIEQLKNWGLNPKSIAEEGMNVYLKQIFDVGFFHADPHPGNVLVKPNGHIALIDFGMVGKLTRNQKYAFAGIMLSLSSRDAKGMASNLRKLASNSEITDLQQFENDLEELIEDFVVLDIGEMNMRDLTGRLQKIIYTYKLQLPGNIFLILRAFSILEGIGKELHPKFKFLNSLKPYGIRVNAEQFSPKNIRSEINFAATQFASLLYSSPVDIKYILKKLRTGEFYTKVELHGFEYPLKKLDSIANRAVFTILIAALLISSSIIYNTQVAIHAATILGIPYLTFIGFSASVLLSIILMLNIFRGKRNGNK